MVWVFLDSNPTVVSFFLLIVNKTRTRGYLEEDGDFACYVDALKEQKLPYPQIRERYVPRFEWRQCGVSAVANTAVADDPHEMKLVESTLEAVTVERPKPTEEKPQNLCMDKGYNFPKVRELVSILGGRVGLHSSSTRPIVQCAIVTINMI